MVSREVGVRLGEFAERPYTVGGQWKKGKILSRDFYPEQLADGWYFLLREEDGRKVAGRHCEFCLGHAKLERSVTHPVVAKRRVGV